MEGRKVVPSSSLTPRAIWLSSSIFVLRAFAVVQPWVKEIPPSVYFPSNSPEMEPLCQLIVGIGGEYQL